MYYLKNILKNPHILPSLLAIGGRTNSDFFKVVFKVVTTGYTYQEKIEQIFEKVLTTIFL